MQLRAIACKAAFQTLQGHLEAYACDMLSSSKYVEG